MNEVSQPTASAETTSLSASHQSRSDGFDFHEPEFAIWWLRSHFLLSIDDQIAVAENLRRVVAVPEVHEVIDQYILSIGRLDHEDKMTDDGSASSRDVDFAPMPKSPIEAATLGAIKVWNERRGLCYLLGVIILGYAARGTYTLLKGGIQLLS